MLPEVRNKLSCCLQEFKRQQIVVIGDLILDQYIWGDVDRISPEAPIPIVKVCNEEIRMGGAASVVANVHYLDCEVIPIGLLGDDQAGKQMISLFDGYGISIEGLVITEGFQTITKKRVLTKQQQLIRVDYEFPSSNSGDLNQLLIDKIKTQLKKATVVIISDYAKGVLSQRVLRATIEVATKYNIPVVCDPGKGVDISWYRGVTTLKPNRLEAEQATGIKLTNKQNILKAAEELQKKCRTKFLSISLDKDGILLYKNKASYRFLQTEVREVYDVTGAGDMVTSILGVMLGNGVDAESAIQMANVAAELEITHMGVVPIPWVDIKNYLDQDGISQKVVSIKILKEEVTGLDEKEVIFTNGYFDQLSAGHLRFLIEIAQIPGKLVVAINSDESIFRDKGNYPLLNQQERARLLASLENVFRVVIFEEPDASNLIQELRPGVVVKGDNFRNTTIPEQPVIKKIGADIKYIQQFNW